ncbi:hypothetical protein Tco_1167610 [Tanacetum coccineum]
MHTIGMTMQQVQVNTKFLNALPSKWSMFVTDVKLAKSLYTTKYDQLYAYLSQHERHANEVRITRKRYLDPLVLQGEDPIECINKAMAFLSVVASRQHQSYAGTRNRGIATTSKGNVAAGQLRVLKCYILLKESDYSDMARQCYPTKKAKDSLQRFLMANISSCDPEVLSEIPYSDSYPNDMINQNVQEMQYYEQTQINYFPDNEIHSDSIIILYSQYLQESQDAVIQDTNSSTPNDLLVLSLVEQMTDHVAHLMRSKSEDTIKSDSQMDDLIRNRNAKLAAFQQEIDTLKETLSNHVKEKESLSKTLTVFKTESKEKESKYIDKEIVLEKQNKELENIISLGYQNPFHLKQTQRIQPILYDGSVIAKEHAVIYVTDDEETLILEEESRSKMLDKQNDPISIEKKIKISPIDYSKLNKIK